jgi:hypothetical protein
MVEVHDHSEINSVYFSACQYASSRLGDASRFFPRLHELARLNSLDELKAIVDSWADTSAKPPMKKVIPDGLWVAGSKWGDSVRVERETGIIWRLKCACGRDFTTSTNDTVPPNKRKCSTCILAEALSVRTQRAVARLETVSSRVLEWHRKHDKLIWKRVHKVVRDRGLQVGVDDAYIRDLHAMVWLKIIAVAEKYTDQGHKVSTWLVAVVDNCLRDHFRIESNRERLAPMQVLDGLDIAAPATRPEEVLPAKPVRPNGAGPDTILTPRSKRRCR